MDKKQTNIKDEIEDTTKKLVMLSDKHKEKSKHIIDKGEDPTTNDAISLLRKKIPRKSN